MLEDQKVVLAQIAALAVSKHCDAILIAGDIYDRPSPSGEAVALFDEFLSSLVEKEIRVFMISGNHDSPERVSYLGDLLEVSGVTVSRRFSGKIQKTSVEDEHGKINIYLLPYLKASMVRPFFPDREITNCEEAIRAILENEPLELGTRNILISHQFITGAEPGGSEELTVGGADSVSADLFDCFDYVALGHIHGAQKIKRETLRYSGSPLKYSFSEAHHTKSVVIVDCNETGNVELRKVPLSLPHELREVKGSMEELMNLPWTEDYVRVVLTDEEICPDARVTLMANFPNMMRFAVENSRTRSEVEVGPMEEAEDKSELQLFQEFYAMQNGGVEPDEQRMCIVREIFESLQEEKE